MKNHGYSVHFVMLLKGMRCVTKNNKTSNRKIVQKHIDLCENLRREKITGRRGENSLYRK